MTRGVHILSDVFWKNEQKLQVRHLLFSYLDLLHPSYPHATPNFTCCLNCVLFLSHRSNTKRGTANIERLSFPQTFLSFVHTCTLLKWLYLLFCPAFAPFFILNKPRGRHPLWFFPAYLLFSFLNVALSALRFLPLLQVDIKQPWLALKIDN